MQQNSYGIFIVIKCRVGEGVCRDVMISEGDGSQDVTSVIGSVINGLRCIEYRPLNTGVLMCSYSIRTAINICTHADDVYD